MGDTKYFINNKIMISQKILRMTGGLVLLAAVWLED
jgi:hypothetical protein